MSVLCRIPHLVAISKLIDDSYDIVSIKAIIFISLILIIINGIPMFSCSYPESNHFLFYFLISAIKSCFGGSQYVLHIYTMIIIAIRNNMMNIAYSLIYLVFIDEAPLFTYSFNSLISSKCSSSCYGNY